MEISISDLFLAYRQAKVSLFFEKRGVGLLELATYEERLAENLQRLQQHLRESEGLFDGIEPGQVWVVPKRRRATKSSTANVTNIGAVEGVDGPTGLDIQIRMTPSPDFAICEILYLWKFGPALDALIPKEAIGYRLDVRDGQIRKDTRWVFEYWPKRYNEFRREGLRSAQTALADGNGPVDILSADLASFYDTVDAAFLVEPSFIEELLENSESQDGFDVGDYLTATQSLLNAHSLFHRKVRSYTGLDWTIGVPIGALTSRLIANVALASMDRAILNQENILCYRRYVDDFVVVGRAGSKALNTIEDMMAHYVPTSHSADSGFDLDVNRLGRRGSTFRFQHEKCRAHRLHGRAGQDFLNAIASDFKHLVSEHRAFMDMSVFDPQEARRIIRAGKETGATVRSLRDADRTKLEHFALSTALNSLERLSMMVDNGDARQLVQSAVSGLERLVADHDGWVESIESAYRLLGIAVGIEDWTAVDELVQRMDGLWADIDQLRQSVSGLYYRGKLIDRSQAWVWLRNYLHEARLEAICGSLGLLSGTGRSFGALDDGLLHRTRRLSANALLKRARRLATSDLRAFDREDDAQLRGKGSPASSDFREGLELDNLLIERLNTIKKFVDLASTLGDDAWAIDEARLFLSTRPPSYFDIARRWLYNVESKGFDEDIFDSLLIVVNAIRGTYYSDAVGMAMGGESAEVIVPISEPDGSVSLQEQEKPRLILGNLVVKQSAFDAAASKVPELTTDRLRALAEVLIRANVAARGTTGKQKSLLVLPELSLPRRWFREVANYVTRYGRYGLVAGLEYSHHKTKPLVYNQVHAVFPGPYGAVATWPWTKRFPAREEAELLEPHGVSLAPSSDTGVPRVVVHSPYGRLGVLICSELLEVNRVADLSGRVDLVLVPSWNTDTSSYDHLIQSVGLQLHAIIGIANNGHYSDCRGWAPRSERWQRDLCRLIERDHNEVVYVDIPLASLRKFHSVDGHKRVTPDSEIAGDKDTKGEKSSKPEWRPLPPNWPKPWWFMDS